MKRLLTAAAILGLVALMLGSATSALAAPPAVVTATPICTTGDIHVTFTGGTTDPVIVIIDGVSTSQPVTDFLPDGIDFPVYPPGVHAVMVMQSQATLLDTTVTVVDCAPPQITGWKVSTADCTTVDGHGSITVTGFTGDDNQSVSVVKGFWVEPIEGVDLPQVLHITANGTYPLDPGTYNWSYGDRNGGGGPGNDFTIGPCPSPSESPSAASPSESPSASPSASPSPSPTPTPVASPTPKPAVTPTPKPTSTTLAAVITLPQTGTIGASTGGSSSPLVPISIALLLVAATGLMLTRRPKSR